MYDIYTESCNNIPLLRTLVVGLVLSFKTVDPVFGEDTRGTEGERCSLVIGLETSLAEGPKKGLSRQLVYM